MTEIGSIRVRSAPKFGDREISTWRFRIFGPFGLILFCFFSFPDFPLFFALSEGAEFGLIQAGRVGNHGLLGHDEA